MKTDIYLTKKLNEAKEKILENLGSLKNYYSYMDVFKVLKNFGYIEEIDFDEIPLYIKEGTANLSNIKTFTKGFITDMNVKIYAIRMNKHFNIFVLHLKNNLLVDKYYSNTISYETLDICYILEEMINNFIEEA